MKRLLLGVLVAASACVTTAPGPATAPVLFTFHSNLWVNLHHFARAAGRGLPVDTDWSPGERATWDSGVAFYRQHYSNRDLLFDDGMIAIKSALRAEEGQATLSATADSALPADLRGVLETLAPIYRAHWWPADDAANRAWIAAVRPLVARDGARLATRVSAAYGETWPAIPVPVDLSVQAGPVGAYTTSMPTATTLSGTDPGYQGLAALEMLFHEASHQWGRRLQTAIAAASETHHKTVPPQLWHAVLFYNAGELTRRTLAEDGISDYVEYATKQGVYPHLCGEGCRERVAAAWDPHLAGRATIAEALDALVAGWPVPAVDSTHPASSAR